jgi:hypothetical protein
MILQEAHAQVGSKLAQPEREAQMSTPPSNGSSSPSSWRVTVKQLWCGVFVHELTMVIQSHRLSVKCRHCGYESRGWALTSTAPSIPSNASTVSTPATLASLPDVARQH